MMGCATLNPNKYIQRTKSNRYAVVFPASLKNPRRLGRYDTLHQARQARDDFLSQMSTSRQSIIKGKGKSIVCLFDLHVPYQDDDALRVASQIIKVVEPDSVVFGGDCIDFFQLSTFNNDTSRSKTTQQELDDWYKVAGELKKSAKNAQWYHIAGNHEQRLQSWLNANRGLESLRALKLPRLLKLSELGIEHGKEVHYLDGRLAITHGRFFSINSGSAVKSEIKRRGFQVSICQGHEHRLGEYRHTGYLYDVMGYSVACLCQNSWYDSDFCNWERGLAVITIYGDKFTVENVKMGDVTIFRGNVYR